MLEYIKTALEAIKLTREAAQTISSVRRSRTQSRKAFSGVDALSAAVFGDLVEDGQVVLLEGVLSRYASFYIPRALPRMLPDQAFFPLDASTRRELSVTLTNPVDAQVRFEAGALKIDYRHCIHPKLHSRSDANLVMRAPYLPVGAMPPLQAGHDGSSTIAFLYPTESTGIQSLSPLAPGADYTVPPGSRGIPVLVPPNADVRARYESVCRVEAVVRKSPERILDLLAGSPLGLRRKIASNFYRPESPTTRGFVLELTRAEAPVSIETAGARFEGTIFLESHIEGLAFKDIHDLFQNFVLQNLPILQEEVRNGWSPGLVAFDGVSALGLPTATLVAKPPNYYAVYSTIDLRSTDAYSTAYQYVRRLADEFAQAINALVRTVRVEKGMAIPTPRFCHDFLFDYECQRDFDASGVLAGDEAAQAVAHAPELATTAEWLRIKHR